MNDNKNILKIAYSVVLCVLLVFITLMLLDYKSTLSEIVVASCTVGLFILSLYGIVFQLGSFLYRKK